MQIKIRKIFLVLSVNGVNCNYSALSAKPKFKSVGLGMCITPCKPSRSSGYDYLINCQLRMELKYYVVLKRLIFRSA